MRAIKKVLCLPMVIVFWSIVSNGANAQDSTGELKVFVQKIQRAYNGASYLGFRVKYQYANERQPGIYTDSLSGAVEMDKGRSRSVIAGTETVLTGGYTIQIMEEEKSMVLAATRPIGIQNPLPMLDSLFAHIDNIRMAVEHTGETDQLTLDFPPGHPYYQMVIVIDSRSGYIRKVEYSLSTTGLVSQDMIDRPGHPGTYQSRGRINILFSDYAQGRFDDRVFSEGNFFTKSDGKYVPAGRYKDYHIYLASTNL